MCQSYCIGYIPGMAQCVFVYLTAVEDTFNPVLCRYEMISDAVILKYITYRCTISSNAELWNVILLHITWFHINILSVKNKCFKVFSFLFFSACIRAKSYGGKKTNYWNTSSCIFILTAQFFIGTLKVISLCCFCRLDARCL